MNEIELPALERSLQRLARSREALRATLLPTPGRADGEGGSLLPLRLVNWLRSGPLGPVMRSVEPWAGGMQRTLQRWWRRHPWRPSAEAAGGTLRTSVVPWARRHPLVAVGLGAAAGAAFAMAAPWRWASLQQMARGSGRGLRRWALHQLTGPAAQTVLASVVTSLLTARATRSAREAPAPAPRQEEAAAQAREPM
jgi:hypothetical protein